MATDGQLIEQIREGKREAYGQLYRKYYQRIYSVCFSVLKNPHDAEEITQETFVHAYLKLDQLKKPDKYFAWLKKIAQNRSKNYVRQTGPEMIPLNLASAQTAREEDSLGGYLLNPIAPDENILRQELMDAIMEAVEALPPKDREVVRAHIDGLSHAEISERFSISVEASMSRLYRARKKLSVSVKDLLSGIFGLPKMWILRQNMSGKAVIMMLNSILGVFWLVFPFVMLFSPVFLIVPLLLGRRKSRFWRNRRKNQLTQLEKDVKEFWRTQGGSQTGRIVEKIEGRSRQPFRYFNRIRQAKSSPNYSSGLTWICAGWQDSVRERHRRVCGN